MHQGLVYVELPIPSHYYIPYVTRSELYTALHNHRESEKGNIESRHLYCLNCWRANSLPGADYVFTLPYHPIIYLVFFFFVKTSFMLFTLTGNNMW